MKKWHVVIHYEGAYDFDVYAKNKEEAEEKAQIGFDEVDERELIANIESSDVCDCWEVEEDV